MNTPKISKELATEMAIKMVILDAIGKGHTDPKELSEYMGSEVFDNAVKSQIAIIYETL